MRAGHPPARSGRVLQPVSRGLFRTHEFPRPGQLRDWAHDFIVQWDAADHDTGHAEFYTATVDTFTPSDALWTDDERVDVLAHKWWTLDELDATTELFEPVELAQLVRSQLEEKNR